MRVSVSDSQGILGESDFYRLREQLYFSLLKFGDQVANVKALIALEKESQKIYCGLDVQLASGKFVSVTVSKSSLAEAMTAAIDAIENKVAFRVDWNAWVNAEKLSTWLTVQKRSLHRAIGLSTAE